MAKKNKLIKFLLKSYKIDKVAFYSELISFIFTVIGSFILALDAKNPNMHWIYPFFIVGAVTGFCTYLRRKVFWSALLAIYFIVINVFGLGRSFGVW